MSIEQQPTQENNVGQESFALLQEHIASAPRIIEDEWERTKSGENKNTWLYCFSTVIYNLALDLTIQRQALIEYIGQERFESLKHNLERLRNARDEVRTQFEEKEVDEQAKEKLLFLLNSFLE